MNSVKKKKYQKQIIKEDAQVSVYVDKVFKNVEVKHDEVANLIYDLGDVVDTWDTALNDINDAIKNRAIEIGVTKGEMDKF